MVSHRSDELENHIGRILTDLRYETFFQAEGDDFRKAVPIEDGTHKHLLPFFEGTYNSLSDPIMDIAHFDETVFPIIGIQAIRARLLAYSFPQANNAIRDAEIMSDKGDILEHLRKWDTLVGNINGNFLDVKLFALDSALMAVNNGYKAEDLKLGRVRDNVLKVLDNTNLLGKTTEWRVRGSILATKLLKITGAIYEHVPGAREVFDSQPSAPIVPYAGQMDVSASELYGEIVPRMPSVDEQQRLFERVQGYLSARRRRLK